VKRRLLLALVAAALTLNARAGAHHRLGDTYVESRQIAIEGEMVRLEYREPHSYIHVMITGPQAKTEVWIGECRGASQLRRQGFTSETLKPGQRVILSGHPGRVAADHRLFVREVVRPHDGWTWRDLQE
jgi:Family of unknown function (DUF6152)